MNIPAVFATALRLQQNGQFAEAEELYRQILAAEPGQAGVHYNLALVLRNRGELAAAVTSYEKALELQPQFPEAANNLGAALEHLGRLDDAEAAFRQALQASPDFSDAWSNLAGVLKNLGRLDEAVDCLDRAIMLQPGNARLQSNRIFTLQYAAGDNSALLAQAAMSWGERFARPSGVSTNPWRKEPDPGRKLRIGYVSAYFREHCQAFFTVPLFRHHDHGQFEIFGYSDVAAPDHITARLQGCADHWRRTERMKDEELAALIREDRIDVLVDLSLHMAQDRLGVFARKPAAVQVTWLGYPGTTGLRTVDYRLTDRWLDPTEAGDVFYSEKSHRLPDSFWCYDPLTDQPAVNTLPAKSTGRVTFGCLNNFCKVTDETLAMWTQVLQAVPDSRLILIAPPGSARERVQSRLGPAACRVEFVSYRPRAEYLQLYQHIDLCLDTFPYNGHTTSLDALWMGVPVVSLCGQTAVSRAGLSLMETLGLPGFVAGTPAEFVTLAVAWAGELDRLAALRAGLRQQMEASPLMNAPRFAANVEAAYRLMWQRGCES